MKDKNKDTDVNSPELQQLIDQIVDQLTCSSKKSSDGSTSRITSKTKRREALLVPEFKDRHPPIKLTEEDYIIDLNKNLSLSIPMTGIGVMTDLSLDAHMLIHLAGKGILLPFRPLISESFMKRLMNCSYDEAMSRVTDWRYWKSDVEDFKLRYKDFSTKLLQEKATVHAESQKRDKSRDKKLCRETAREYVEKCKSRKTPSIIEAVRNCRNSEHGAPYTDKQVRNWITDKSLAPIFPPESSKGGRRKNT